VVHLVEGLAEAGDAVAGSSLGHGLARLLRDKPYVVCEAGADALASLGPVAEGHPDLLDCLAALLENKKGNARFPRASAAAK
jgi:hypothetical protein